MNPSTLPALIALLCALAGSAPAAASAAPVRAAEGLWAYTGLVTRDGRALPLSGLFLIRNGLFVQQSVFDAAPFETAGSMAHAGPYWAGGAGLRLRSRPTLSLDPGSATPIRSAGAVEHDLKVERRGDTLTLTFGAGRGTVQTLRRLGAARTARVFRFEDGALALAEGYFILALGNREYVLSGYGRYTRSERALDLDIMRWAESDGTAVRNRKNTALRVSFDGATLGLPDGRRFSTLAPAPPDAALRVWENDPPTAPEKP